MWRILYAKLQYQAVRVTKLAQVSNAWSSLHTGTLMTHPVVASTPLRHIPQKQQSSGSQQLTYSQEKLSQARPLDLRLGPWTHRFRIEIAIWDCNLYKRGTSFPSNGGLTRQSTNQDGD